LIIRAQLKAAKINLDTLEEEITPIVSRNTLIRERFDAGVLAALLGTFTAIHLVTSATVTATTKTTFQDNFIPSLSGFGGLFGALAGISTLLKGYYAGLDLQQRSRGCPVTLLNRSSRFG
jgi:hypothetical protein